MSGLPVIGRTGKQIDRAITVYIDRCMLIIERAFQESVDRQKGFRTWIDEQFEKTRSPAVLLHDDPVYTVARFLGISRLEIDPSVMKRATRLAKEQNWQ
jgi:hypothetical protein